MCEVVLQPQWLLISLASQILVSGSKITVGSLMLMRNPGTKGKEYPTRFFARDFGGNLLEFTM
jgi:hypothetical protein